MQSLVVELNRISESRKYGKVSAIQGLLVSVEGIANYVSIGSRCIIKNRNSRKIISEVVGFRDKIVLIMPFSELDGVGLGCKVYTDQNDSMVYPNNNWLGRIVNAMGEPIDDKGPLSLGITPSSCFL